MADILARVFEQLFNLERRDKQILQSLADALAVVTSLFLAFALNDVPLDSHAVAEAAVLALFTVAILMAFGTYRAMVRYLSFGLSPQVFGAVAILALCLLVFHALERGNIPPRSALDFALLSLLFMSIPRLMLRWIFENIGGGNKSPVVIFGAGVAGRQLAMALSSHSRFRVVGFVDDDAALFNARMVGLPVRSSARLEAWIQSGIEHVLLAMPNASVARRKEIIASLEHLEVDVKTVPDMDDLVSGKARVGELRNIDVDDLLGRDPVAASPELIAKDIQGKIVMVTGAGGSIGSELCRQIVLQKPQTLILFERSEHALYAIEKSLVSLISGHLSQIKLVPILGSVCDQARVTSVIESWHIQTIYHAAAYKHVPLVESNAMAAIENNVQGTWKLAQAAVEARIESFVLISTDKAVRPTNVMGATKRLAELAVQALASQAPRTRLSIVRFGNVLGSSGSVVPLFRSQIEQGGPVTVTHPDVIRYFMTIPEAAQLVIQAGAMGRTGDVFVLDMGEPVNIHSLAERMIRLAGCKPRTAECPEGDIEITMTGLRPGEKLYEELLISENVEGTQHPRICRSTEPSMDLVSFKQLLSEMGLAHDRSDMHALVNLLNAAPLQYQPTLDTASDLALIRPTAKVALARGLEPPQSSFRIVGE